MRYTQYDSKSSEEKYISELKYRKCLLRHLFSEIDSFALKFKSLLARGIMPTLTFESEEGTAHVTLKAGLGSNYVPTARDMSLMCQNSNVFSSKKHRSPAYSRR